MRNAGAGLDNHAVYCSVPQNPDEQQKVSKVSQTLLFVLLTVALFGIAAEGYFISHLYHHEYLQAASALMLMNSTAGLDKPDYLLASKPAAHLTDESNVVHGEMLMHWSLDQDTLIHDMAYKDGRLEVQKEGYYYVYSKVFFSDHGVFHHSVRRSTERPFQSEITLMQSRKHSPYGRLVRSNSYLGGVFHLYEGDSIFVTVSSTYKIERHHTCENFFGAFMI